MNGNSLALLVNNFKNIFNFFLYNVYRRTIYKIPLCKIVFNLFKSKLFDINRYNVSTPTSIETNVSSFFSFSRVDWIQFWKYVAFENTMYSYFTIAFPIKEFQILREEMNFCGMLIVTLSTILAKHVSDGCGLRISLCTVCLGGCLTLNRSKNDRHQRNNGRLRRKNKNSLALKRLR